MQHTIKDLPKGQKEIRVEISWDEMKPFLERAATELSQRVKIEGFRPGKASYDIVSKKFGEAAVLEEALPSVVQKFMVQVVREAALETIGEPSINVEKAAPGNEVIFTAKVSLLPKIIKLADLDRIKVEAKPLGVKDEDVKRVVDDLRKMQSTEHDVDREVGPTDKVIVDMEMMRDKVVIEGGTAKNHGIYLAEPTYVPGLAEKIVGMKKGENRLFTLKFPEDHFNKMLAGHDVEFSVDLKGVLEIRNPEADEEFAKKLGQESLEKLQGLLRKNLEDEAKIKEEQRQEIAAIEDLLKGSEFGEIPDMLLNAEAHKMVHELEHSVTERGGTFADYLKSVKKTHDQLVLDFAPEAIKRVKTSVLMREIGKREKLEPDDKELLDEQLKLINMYKDDADTQARIRSEEGEDYIRGTLRNRKVLKFLREKAVK